MRRIYVNYFLDLLLFLDMIGVAFIGLLLGFVIPRGGGPHAGKYLWGFHRHQWGNLHIVLSLIMLGLLALHLVLHWSWIVCRTRELLGERSRKSD